MDLWTSPTDRREPCGPCGQPVDNADSLPTACPHSRASRPQAPQDQPPVILRGQHRTTLRRGCLHRPFKTTSASHSNPSQHRPRPGSPPSLQAHFRMGLDCFRKRVQRAQIRVLAGRRARCQGRRETRPKGAGVDFDHAACAGVGPGRVDEVALRARGARRPGCEARPQIRRHRKVCTQNYGHRVGRDR